MSDFAKKDYKVFDLFKNQWALVSAGTLDNYNACTVSWGSFGTLWTRPGQDGQVVTVYLHPARYTQKFFAENDTFTVSFLPQEYKRALGYMGSHTGRNEDKAANAGLTPVEINGSVGFKEANLTFTCRKVYAHQFAKEGIAKDVQEYYKSFPDAYPVDENGEWQPHWVFVGDIIAVEDKR